MRRCLVLCLSILALFAPIPAFAAEWTGTQVMFTVEGTKPITEAFAWSGTACRFECPKNSTAIWFAYTGPNYQATPWLWVAPQVGYAGGWVQAEDTLVGAGWGTVTLPNGIGTVDLDGEVFTTAGHNDTYWYNQYNHSWGALNAGLHWESVNGFSQWGPQIGVKQGPWKGEVRYFTGEGAHALRLAVKLGF